MRDTSLLRDNNPIRVSRSLRDTAYKALQARERIISKTLKEPTEEEIAKELGVEQSEIVFALDAIQDPVSLFEPIYNDGGDPIYVMDQISDDADDEDDWIDHLSLREGIKRLNPREKLILTKRFPRANTNGSSKRNRNLSSSSIKA